MDDALYFSEQHLAVREMVRSFAHVEVAPVAAQPGRSGEYAEKPVAVGSMTIRYFI